MLFLFIFFEVINIWIDSFIIFRISLFHFSYLLNKIFGFWDFDVRIVQVLGQGDHLGQEGEGGDKHAHGQQAPQDQEIAHVEHGLVLNGGVSLVVSFPLHIGLKKWINLYLLNKLNIKKYFYYVLESLILKILF